MAKIMEPNTPKLDQITGVGTRGEFFSLSVMDGELVVVVGACVFACECIWLH